MNRNKIKIILVVIAVVFTLVPAVPVQLTAQDAEKDQTKQGESVAPEKSSEAAPVEGEITEATDLEVGAEETEAVDEEEEERQGSDSLFATVKQGGPLMIFIFILAITSMTIIVERIIYFTKNNIWKNIHLITYLRELASKSGMQYKEDMEDMLRSEFQIYANGMERGLALLSGIGNLSPIVGFLGTVIGMINAFASIAAATTVNAKVVAEGIQIALVTTAGGLSVAAPTLAFVYLFTHVIQNRYANAESVITEISGSLPGLSDRLSAGTKGSSKKSSAKKTGSRTRSS